MFCEENRHNQYPKAGCNQRKAGEVGKWGSGVGREEKGSCGKMMRSGLGILILTAGRTNGLPAGPEAFGKMKAFSVMILQEKKALPFHCPIRMAKGQE